MTAATASPRTRGRPSPVDRAWPVVLAVVAAGGLVWVVQLGHLGARQVASVLPAAGLVYLASVVFGRRAAWPTFVLTVVAIAVGNRVAMFHPLMALGAAVAVLVVGALAQRPSRRDADRAALDGAATQPRRAGVAAAESVVAAFTLAVAVASLAATRPWASVILLAAGLLAHAGWGVARHRGGDVPASMVLFCVVFECLVALGLLVGTGVGHG